MVGVCQPMGERIGKEREAGDAQGKSSLFFFFFDGKAEFIQGNYYNGVVGGQNLPCHNMSLICGLFPAENNQGPEDSGRNWPPPKCLKGLR